MDDFCDDRAAVVDALEALGPDPLAADPARLGSVADAMRGVDGPEELRADLDALADVLDAVAEELAVVDPDDPDSVVAAEEALRGLEERLGSVDTAAAEVARAIEACPPEGEGG